MKIVICALSLLLFGTGFVGAKKNKQLFPEMPGMVSFTYRNSFAKDVAATLDTLKIMGFKDIDRKSTRLNSSHRL